MSTAAPATVDALERVLAARSDDRGHVLSALLLASLVHGVLAYVMPTAPAVREDHLAPPTQWVELQPPPKEIEPPKVEPEKPREEPKIEPALRSAKAAPEPPQHAQAAAVVTQKEDPNSPADFTDSMVVGNADTYAGGVTSQAGTSTKRVASAGTVAGKGPPSVATAPAAAAVGPDLSRKARVAGGASWSCPFPAEADVEQLDHAVVTLRIVTSASGAPLSVNIVSEPGNGFGREARSCALRKSYDAALDRAGKPVEGSTLVNVRFDR
jgi:periplasmic protein TonB